MARTAPVPNIPAIPGMCPGIVVAGGGGGSGGGSGKGAGGGGGGVGAGGEGGAAGAGDGSRSADAPPEYPGCGTASHPVDVVTGRAFTHAIRDMSLRGPLPLTFTRSYSSTMRKEDRGLGHGWAHSFGWSLRVKRRRITVFSDKGTAVEFPAIAVGEKTLGQWGWLLRRESWGYLLDAGDGRWHAFSEGDEAGEYFRLTAIEDRNKNRIALTYEDGKLSEITDSGGRTIRVETTAEGRIAAFKLKNAKAQGRWVTFARYEYDQHGNLTSVTDPEGHIWHYGYDEGHRLTSDTDRCGLTFHFVYDAKGRCQEAWGDYGGMSDLSLDDSVPTQLADGITRAKGIHHCRFRYEDDGYSEVADSTQVRRFFGNQHGLLDKQVEGGAVTTAAYDDNGFMTGMTDPLGHTALWERDPRGRILKETDPYGRETVIERNEAGLPIKVIDKVGNESTWARDRNGNCTTRQDAEGNITTVRFDERGLPIHLVDGSGGNWRTEYDAEGNIVAITQPNGAVWKYEYDSLGRCIAVSDPTGATKRHTFDDRGDLLAVHDANGGVTRFRYDGEGHPIWEQLPSGVITEYVWSGYHRVCEKKNANGGVTRLRYNREGDLTRVINARGDEHSFERDEMGRLVGETTFDGRSYRYDNDGLGRIVRRRDSNGEWTQYAWGAAGELLEKVYADDSAVGFEYDPFNRVTGAKNDTGTFRFERDKVGRVVREHQHVAGNEHSVSYEYNGLGDVLKRSTSLGFTEEIQRDAAGMRTRTLLDGKFELRHDNDPLGRELTRALPGGGRIESQFDGQGRLLSRRAFAPTAAPARGGEPEWLGPRTPGATVERSYSYDPDGELVGIADPQYGSTEYGYDPCGQLLTAASPEGHKALYRYDETGNLYEEQQGAEDSARQYEGGRLLRKGDTDYAWDAEGRLTRKRVGGEQGAEWRYEWNAQNCLTSVHGPDGTTVEFAYDPFMRRMAKRVVSKPAIEDLPKVVSQTLFVWEGERMVHELTKRAQERGDPIVEERTFAFEDHSYEPLAQRGRGDDVSAQSGWLTYINDASGAPDRLVAPNGRVVCELHRDALGKMKVVDQGATTPLRLQGQYHDDETGLAYNRNRYYDPETGHFIKPDPVGIQAALNAYRLGPNTVSWIDPSGLTLRPTLLGESMSRVTPTATAEGHHTFNPRSSYSPGDPGADAAFEKNQRRWMRDQIDSGRTIYDIGQDPNRGPTERSPYCRMEHEELRAAGFRPQCTGRTVNVNGVDTPLTEWVPPPGFTPGDARRARDARRGR